MNKENDVDFYFPSCKKTKICEHVLAVLYQIQELNPEKFPFSYERKLGEKAVESAEVKKAEPVVKKVEGKSATEDKKEDWTVKELTPIRKKTLQEEIRKERQDIESMVKENSKRRELMKQFAISSHILQESRIYYLEIQKREHVEKVHLFVNVETNQIRYVLYL